MRKFVVVLLFASVSAHATMKCSTLLAKPTVRRVSVGVLLLGLVGAAEPEGVDMQLVLATDVSGSIDVNEYDVQRYGIARALVSPEVEKAIRTCAPRGVALAYAEWDDAYNVVVSSRRVNDAASMQAFVREMDRFIRPQTNGSTDLELALHASKRELDESPLPAARRVIDLSSDGIQNVDRTGAALKDDSIKHQRLGEERDRVVATGVTINVLSIDLKTVNSPNGGEKTLTAYFKKWVMGGPAAFTQVTPSFAGVRVALTKKLEREICSGATF